MLHMASIDHGQATLAKGNEIYILKVGFQANNLHVNLAIIISMHIYVFFLYLVSQEGYQFLMELSAMNVVERKLQNNECCRNKIAEQQNVNRGTKPNDKR